MTERVLVTGASGFLGQPTVAALAAGGAEVHALGRTRPHGDAAHWHECDLLAPGAAARVVDAVRPTHLVHAAWTTDPNSYWTSPDNDRWAGASRELVERFAARGGRRALLVGTCAEYDWSGGGRLREDSPLAPASPYARAKDALRRAAEQVPGLSVAWARLFFLYGPRERPQRLVPTVLEALAAGRSPQLSSGEHRRDYLYVDDAAGALAALLLTDLEGPVNVGSGRAVAVRDLVLAIARAAGRADLIRFGARPARDEPPLIEADVERLTAAIGFAPRSLEAGAAATVSRRA